MEAGNIDISSSSSSGTLEHVSSEIMVIAIITLFMVVVFVFFFHLYNRWSRGPEAVDETNPRARRRRFVFNYAPTHDPLVAVHKGLEPSLLRDLPVLIFHPDNFKQGLECAVCLSELEDGDRARLLPNCNHGFHVDCIDMWFHSHSTCPLCRSTVGESNPQFPSLHDHLGSGYSIESPDLPTELEQPIHTSSSSTSHIRRVQFGSPDGNLVIEIPSRRLTDGFNTLSPSTPASRFSGDEIKSPTIPLRSSLMRLLSWEKMVIRCSPSLVDVEQGGGGRGQSSITSSETSS